MQIQLPHAVIIFVLTMVAFSGLSVVAADNTETLDGTVQFEPETSEETTPPHDIATVEQALGTVADSEANTTLGRTYSDALPFRDSRDCHAKSHSQDSDNDYVTNFRECKHGTDETNFDTDGDTLTDAEELLGVTKNGTPIPDSDPREKDIYLIIGLSDGAYIDAGEMASLFSTFDIDNPSGELGINLHYETRQLNRTARAGNFDKHENDYKTRLTGRTDVYRGLLVTTGTEGAYIGKADVGGNFAATQRGKEKVATHEILHLVVGQIPETDCQDPYHNCHGQTILSPRVSDIWHNEMSHNTTVHIETTGFDPQRPNNAS